MAVLTKDDLWRVVSRGRSARLEQAVAPKFRIGDRIVVRNLHPAGHTRMPRSIRGKRGVIERDHGVFSYPDSNAHGGGPSPQHVYSVRFQARELWGPEASPRDSICMDLWDDYMDRA